MIKTEEGANDLNGKTKYHFQMTCQQFHFCLQSVTEKQASRKSELPALREAL